MLSFAQDLSATALRRSPPHHCPLRLEQLNVLPPPFNSDSAEDVKQNLLLNMQNQLEEKNTFKMPAPLPGSSAAVHPHLRIPPLQFPLPIWQPRHLSWALEPASFCCSCLAPVVPKLPECLLGGLCSDLRFVAL